MASIKHDVNQLTPAAWAADGRGADSLVPGGARVDAAQFPRTDAVTVTLGAAAAADAVALTVAALSGPIPAGTLLHFGQTGEMARVTAAAAAGAVSLTVEAIPVALENGDVATYAGLGKRVIRAGTLVGRTYTERGNAVAFGQPDVATPDDELFLVAFDVTDADASPDVELYRHGRMVKENFLPGWATLATNVKAAIRSRYQCVLGVA